jgi:hypothetical protein
MLLDIYKCIDIDKVGNNRKPASHFINNPTLL